MLNVTCSRLLDRLLTLGCLHANTARRVYGRVASLYMAERCDSLEGANQMDCLNGITRGAAMILEVWILCGGWVALVSVGGWAW